MIDILKIKEEEFDKNDMCLLKELLEEKLDSDNSTIIVDFKNVKHINKFCLAFLSVFQKKAFDNNNKIIIYRNMNNSIHEQIKLLQLDELLVLKE